MKKQTSTLKGLPSVLCLPVIAVSNIFHALTVDSYYAAIGSAVLYCGLACASLFTLIIYVKTGHISLAHPSWRAVAFATGLTVTSVWLTNSSYGNGTLRLLAVLVQGAVLFLFFLLYACLQQKETQKANGLLPMLPSVALSVYYATSPWVSNWDSFSKFILCVLVFASFSLFWRYGKDLWQKYAASRTNRLFFCLLTAFSVFLWAYNKIVPALDAIRLGFGGAAFLLYSVPLFCVFGWSVLGFTDWLQVKLASPKPSCKPAKLWLALFAIIAGAWLVWWAGFFPATMSPDSMVQWSQAHGYTPLEDAHPLAHTLWVRLFTYFTESPAIYIFVQLVLLACLYASILLFLQRKGLPPKWALGTAALFGLLPNLGIYSVTMWKDVPFLAAVLWLAFIFMRIISSKNISWAIVPEITIALSITALFRHNGFIVTLLSGVFLLVCSCKRKSLSIGAGIAVAVAAILIFQGTVYSALGVTRNGEGPARLGLLAVATALEHEAQEPKAVFEEALSIQPKELWAQYYNPYNWFSYAYNGEHDFYNPYLEKGTGDIVKLWLDVFLHNPGLLLYERMAMNDTNLFINEADNPNLYNSRYLATICPNTYGLTTYETPLTRFLSGFLDATTRNTILDSLLWRNGLMILVCMWLVYYNFCRSNLYRCLLFVPMAGNILSLVISLSEQSYRYTHNLVPLAIIGFLVAGLPQTYDVPMRKAPLFD